MGGLQPLLEAVVGFALIGGAIWASAVLLKRLAGLDTMSAVVVSTVTVPVLLFGAFFVWGCLSSPSCVF